MIVDNTFRDAKVKGAASVSRPLESGYLGGKCADLNALYVGLPERRFAGPRCLRRARGRPLNLRVSRRYHRRGIAVLGSQRLRLGG
jgi:hypothetical protein